MKVFSTRLLCLLSIIICFSQFAWASKIEIAGIYYNILDVNSVEVTFRGDEEDGWMYFSAEELYSGDIIIPETIEYESNIYIVSSIGKDAFAGSRAMTSLSLPKSIVTIGSGAFTLCNSLETIVVDDENSVFQSYNGILYQKNPLTLYFVPRGIQGEVELLSVTTIPSSAFQNCWGLTSIVLPETVTTIQDGAFNSCTALSDIVLDNSLQSIGVQAFSKCSALQLITIPSSVTSIGSNAFTSCTNLVYLLLKEGLQTIDDYAFYLCESISAIELPSTLQSIGTKAFDGCESLATIKNNSDLQLTIGSETNGCVAKYATNIETADDEQVEVNYQDSILNLIPLGNDVYRYGYNELSENDKATYDYILRILTGFEANKEYSIYHKVDFDFASQGVQMDIYSLMYMLERIYRDVPEMYILNTIPRSADGILSARILMTYTPESYYNELKEISAICDEIVSRITSNMTTYEKLKVLHDGLIDITDYGGMSSAYSGNIKGAFLEKKIVCEGFSRAFLYLCQKAGIPCLYVSGSLLTSDEPETWGNHAWNFVQVDGKWYLADVTTDGAFPGVCGYSAFLKGQDYFDANYKITNTSGGNENTANNVYSVLPILEATAYEPNAQQESEQTEIKQYNSGIKMFYNSMEHRVYVEFSQKGNYKVELYLVQGQLLEQKCVTELSCSFAVPKVKGVFLLRILQHGKILFCEKF